MKIDKTKLDISQIFLTYMTLVGDVSRTAAALDLEPALVQALAEQEGWSEKVRRLSVMSKSNKPGDYERAQNRALNFVQAHRFRSLLTGIMAAYEERGPRELIGMVRNGASSEKPGHDLKLSCSFIRDLSTAIQNAQNMCYAALGDSVAERNERGETEEGVVSGDALHAAVVAALNGSAMRKETPATLMARAQEHLDFPAPKTLTPNLLNDSLGETPT